MQPLFGEAMEYEGAIEDGYAVEGGLTMEAVMAQVTKEGFEKHVAAMEHDCSMIFCCQPGDWGFKGC